MTEHFIPRPYFRFRKQQLINLVKIKPLQIKGTDYNRTFCERVQNQDLTKLVSIGDTHADGECYVYHSSHPTISFSFKTERGMKIALGKVAKLNS